MYFEEILSIEDSVRHFTGKIVVFLDGIPQKLRPGDKMILQCLNLR